MLKPYAEGGICADGGTVNVGEARRPFALLAAAAFDAYLRPVGKRHASAVQAELEPKNTEDARSFRWPGRQLQHVFDQARAHLGHDINIVDGDAQF